MTMFSGGAHDAFAIFQVAAVFVHSLLLTYIRRVGGSVALCIIAHALYNAGAIVVGLAGTSGP